MEKEKLEEKIKNLEEIYPKIVEQINKTLDGRNYQYG